MYFRIIFLLLFLVFVLPLSAEAACVNPSGSEGEIVFNDDFKYMQFCNGNDWVAMGLGAYKGSGAAWGYFVYADVNLQGDFGGLSGADAECLTELTTQDWMGKATAQAAGILTASNVKAFLCDSATCNNANADTLYLYARAGDTSKGGLGFMTDSSGSGPRDDNPWSSEDGAFGSGLSLFWSNRASGTNSFWGTTPEGSGADDACSDWTDNGAVPNGNIGQPATGGNGRWDNANLGCVGSYDLICFVNP